MRRPRLGAAEATVARGLVGTVTARSAAAAVRDDEDDVSSPNELGPAYHRGFDLATGAVASLDELRLVEREITDRNERGAVAAQLSEAIAKAEALRAMLTAWWPEIPADSAHDRPESPAT